MTAIDKLIYNDSKIIKTAQDIEKILHKMKKGDRGLFHKETGHEYFIAKDMSNLKVGLFKIRKYILPIEYLDDIKQGIKLEAGYQVNALDIATQFVIQGSC